MNNKRLIFQLVASLQILSNGYNRNIDSKYFLDQDVTNCQFKLYIAMLKSTIDMDYEKEYKEFLEAFNELSLDKQEFIKQDIKNILTEQEKNNKEKEKIL